MVGPARSRTERGGALLLVMWMSAALAAIAVSVSVSIRAETEHTSTMSDGLRAHYLAVGSVERMLAWMSWGPNPGSTRAWSPTVARYYMQYPSGDAVVEMISEASKLNVNTADPVEMLPIVAAVVGDPRLAMQITNGILSRRTAGGGAPVFGPTSTFAPRDASFEEIEELLSVPGVTPEIFYGNYVSDADGRLYARGGLRDVLSVWGTRDQFDVNGAAPALLEGIGVPPSQVQAILQQRAVRPIENASQFPGGAGAHLRVGGISMWTIRANARLRNADGSTSEVVRSAGATVKVWLDGTHGGAPVQVVRYYPDAWSDYAAKPPYIPVGAPR
jgi:general secretion pathway protein K